MRETCARDLSLTPHFLVLNDPLVHIALLCECTSSDPDVTASVEPLLLIHCAAALGLDPLELFALLGLPDEQRSPLESLVADLLAQQTPATHPPKVA